jgi:fucose 4-O-acetylase-like acetyltransferase
VRVAAVVVLVLALALSYLRVESIRDLKLRKWVRMGANYADLDVTEWWAGLVRLALLLLAVVLGLCVMSLVPRGRSLLSTWGRRTMYVYLLHLIPLYLLGQLTDAYEWFDSLPRFALAILLGTLWAVVLASGVVARVFRPLVEPRLEWLRARDLTVPAVSGAGGAAPGRLAAPTDR